MNVSSKTFSEAGTDLSEAPETISSGRPISAGGQDRLLDVVRGIAIVRVVLWHTWSWAWLSWIPAMPAMFFTSGALLDRSLTRRGWARTVHQRLRRLLIPYWIYAAVCWLIMLIDGWRPTLWQGLSWLIPLNDPTGSSDLPGLWVPLWYIRAYIWFVLASGLIRAAQRRLGSAAIAVSSVAAVAVWWVSYRGHDVPMAVGDALAYLPFVLAGIQYSNRGSGARRTTLAALSLAAAVASVGVVMRFGPADKVVNRSYLLTLLVGAAGIAAMVAARAPVISATSARPRIDSVIKSVNSHALSIYLWQGPGLVVAQRLVDMRIENPVLSAVAGLSVVATVITGAVFLFGWIEDWAAGKHPRLPRPRSLPLGAGAACLVAAALLVQVPGDTTIEAPLSGRAVVARAGLVEKSLEQGASESGSEAVETTLEAAQNGSRRKDPVQVMTEWVNDNRVLLDRIGSKKIEAVLLYPDGTTAQAKWTMDSSSAGASGLVTDQVDPIDLSWWSMTKTVTSAWMMRLVEAGVVELDDRLSKWVPEAPHADEITLEQLARHTSGIPSSLDDSVMVVTPVDAVQKFYRSGRLEFRPGQGFNYSRIGYDLLALALERASSTTWVDAVRDMGERAGIEVRFDEDQTPFDRVTDPDGHGYRGGLWASGGLMTSMDDSVRLLHWIFTSGLASQSIDAMTRFSTDPDYWYYGLGLMPGCPCDEVDGYLSARRFGLDSATGLDSVDRSSGAVVMLRPDIWWENKEPVVEFYDLSNRLLDSAVA